ncbi:MAG: hypothetical protein CMG69_02275 [Candidatus Marinimicrobia bacterium]|nr:hypothetical protein [Candidatus Neomarinimicrobiota bacterium]|tara:strand:- start:132 stop:965 length:834 start_codon:yes stop_codon:yes gene_type:complete
MDKPTVALITAVWKRPELTKLVLDRFKNIQSELTDKINIKLIGVGSEGNKSRNLCESRGFFYVECENAPLNRKYNSASRATKQFNPDAVFRIDSDDWVTSDIFEQYLKKIEEGEDAVGLIDLYFLDLQQFILGKWNGYGFLNNRVDRYEAWRRKLKGRTHGVARCFSKRLMEALNWELWDDDLELNSWLDGNCDKRLKRYQFKIKGYRMRELGVLALDIKGGGTNVTKNTFKKLKLKLIQEPRKFLTSTFPESEVKNLFKLYNSIKNTNSTENHIEI